ncbi:hypothetical protein CRH10_09410 [Faecalibacterium prausnitzii]|uniref:Uncharacterized protein n=1 Tax=Faecalibacterium prausnitzii TaxID=853 RepID=A0A291TBS6_9FIRM|nr:hypothetical protein CRH10_09410 [Faecalibacterium prausnitzii]
MDHPPPEDKNHRLQSVVLFVLLALCGMVWYTRFSSTNRDLMVCKRPLTHGKHRCQCPLIAKIRSFD